MVFRMFFAVHRRLASLEIQVGHLQAGVTSATLRVNVYHAVLSMSLAVRGRLAPLGIKARVHLALLVSAATHLRHGLGC